MFVLINSLNLDVVKAFDTDFFCSRDNPVFRRCTLSRRFLKINRKFAIGKNQEMFCFSYLNFIFVQVNIIFFWITGNLKERNANKN